MLSVSRVLTIPFRSEITSTFDSTNFFFRLFFPISHVNHNANYYFGIVRQFNASLLFCLSKFTVAYQRAHTDCGKHLFQIHQYFTGMETFYYCCFVCMICKFTGTYNRLFLTRTINNVMGVCLSIALFTFHNFFCCLFTSKMNLCFPYKNIRCLNANNFKTKMYVSFLINRKSMDVSIENS